MTTDAERISNLEGIVRQTNVILENLQRGQEANHAAMEAGFAAMQANYDALRTEMQARDTALRAEMQARDATIRAEMQAGDAAIRAEMAGNMRTTLVVAFGIGAAVLAAIIPAYFM